MDCLPGAYARSMSYEPIGAVFKSSTVIFWRCCCVLMDELYAIMPPFYGRQIINGSLLASRPKCLMDTAFFLIILCSWSQWWKDLLKHTVEVSLLSCASLPFWQVTEVRLQRLPKYVVVVCDGPLSNIRWFWHNTMGPYSWCSLSVLWKETEMT